MGSVGASRNSANNTNIRDKFVNDMVREATSSIPVNGEFDASSLISNGDIQSAVEAFVIQFGGDEDEILRDIRNAVDAKITGSTGASKSVSNADKQRLEGYKKSLDSRFKHYEHEGYDIYKVGNNQYAAYDFNRERTAERLKKIKSVADVAVLYGKTLKEVKNSLSASRRAK